MITESYMFLLLACFLAFAFAQITDNSGFLPITGNVFPANSIFYPTNSTLVAPNGTETRSNSSLYPSNKSKHSPNTSQNRSNSSFYPSNGTLFQPNGTEISPNSSLYPFNTTELLPNATEYPFNMTNTSKSRKNSTKNATTASNNEFPFVFPFNNTPLTNKSNTTLQYAHAVLLPVSGYNVSGNVSFYQISHNKSTKISIKISGLAPNTNHSLYIHRYGDLSRGCQSIGPIWNPQNAGLNTTRVFRRIISNSKGVAVKNFSDDEIFLTSPYSVVGRAIAVHKNLDDFGNFTEPFMGSQSITSIACGVIGIAKDFVAY